MELSKRVNALEVSGIRKVFELAQQAGPDTVNLSIGQPHSPVSTALKNLAKEYIEKDFNSYMSTMGYLPLRKKIATKLREKNNIDASFENVIITSGVSGGIFLLLSSIVNEGDEVVLPDPYFVLYEQVLRYLGATIVRLDTYPDFRIHPERLEQVVSEKTKCILINSPNNPTGMVYSKDELEQVVAVARKYNTLVISDEIYEAYDFENKFCSIGSLYENTVTLNGFSKSLSVTGWRVGYAHGPTEIVQAMNTLQMYSYVCVPGFAQASIADVEEQAVFDYRENRDVLYKALSSVYELTKPEGAFYAFLKNPENESDFFQKLIDHKLLVVPGKVFSKENTHVRISFAVKKETLEKGLDILKKIK